MNEKEYMKTNKPIIISERIVESMSRAGLNQLELAALIRNEIQDDFNSSNISLWTGGRRNVPLKYLDPLVKILNVTKPYLLGVTNDPNTDWDEIESVPDKSLPRYRITFDDLFAYDKLPIYVEFTNLFHANGWAIYNRSERLFHFSGMNVREKDVKHNGAALYSYNPFESRNPLKQRISLDHNSLMEAETVYIQTLSPDPEMRALYDGWYHHNENHTALVNADGLVMPYNGLRKSYQAFRFKFNKR